MLAIHSKKAFYSVINTLIIFLAGGMITVWLVSNVLALIQHKADDTVRPKQMKAGEFTILYEGDFLEFELQESTAEGQKVTLMHTDDKFWTNSKGCSIIQTEQLQLNCSGILVAILFVQKTPAALQEDGVITKIPARVLNTTP